MVSDNWYKRLLYKCSLLVLQVYNAFPWLGKWFGNRRRAMMNTVANRKQMADLIRGLKESLNPHMCRGLVDSFLAHKQNLEV